MTQNAEQKVRTREEQVISLSVLLTALASGIPTNDDPDAAMKTAEQHIAEAEARGAAEQRRKGAEIAGYIPANTSNFFALSEAAHTSTAMHKKPFPGDVPVYYSANVAALEARVKVLEGERDALKKQIQAMNPGSARPVIHSPTRFMDDSRAALTREGGV